MTTEPEDERAARRDARTVEIARVLVLMAIAAIGVALVLSPELLGGSDMSVAVAALCSAGALVLALRRIVGLRRSGL